MKINKNRVITFLIFTAFSFFCHQLFAQDLNKIKNIKSGYILGNQLYLKKDMKDLFRENPDAIMEYAQAKYQNKIAKNNMSVSISTSLHAIFLIVVANKRLNSNSNSSGSFFFV